MKKIYITPIVEEINMQNEESLMTGSINNNLGIGYGGLDTSGERDPASRRMDDWDWDDDDDY